MNDAVEKREPEIAPCPNPECKSQNMDYEIESITKENRFGRLVCLECGYASPMATDMTEINRLHNLIARRE